MVSQWKLLFSMSMNSGKMSWDSATIYIMRKGAPILPDLRPPFTTVMNNYARELGILKEKDANFTGADIRNGMTAVVSIKHRRQDSRARPRQSWTTRMRPRPQERLQEKRSYCILTEIWRCLKVFWPVRKNPPRSGKQRKRPRPISLRSRNILLILTENWQTVRKEIHRSVRSLS